MSEPTDLIGKKIRRIWMSEDQLVFDTDQGLVGYTVEGDCCSWSYFYDFHGVDKLLSNGPVISVNLLDVNEIDGSADACTQAYGYQVVTESEKWGEQTSVFSFRNDSNGYYGGWMEVWLTPAELRVEFELTSDKYGE